MEAKLIVVGGKASKREIALKLPTTIGRSREADLTVAHAMVSRRHCEMYEVDGLLMIRDVGSLNGTFVGDQKVGEAPLAPGAEFTVGPLTFAVKYEYAGDLSSLPPVVGPSENRTEPAESSDATEPEPAASAVVSGEDPPDVSTWDALDLVGEAPDSLSPETTEPSPTPPPTAAAVEEESLDFELAEEPGETEEALNQQDDNQQDGALELSELSEEEAEADEVGEIDVEETPAIEIEEVLEPEEKPVIEEVAAGSGDDGFEVEEVALESLEEENAPAEEPAKAPKKEADAEPDPEDEALDDFLKGLQ